MAPKSKTVTRKEENISLGPQIREGALEIRLRRPRDLETARIGSFYR